MSEEKGKNKIIPIRFTTPEYEKLQAEVKRMNGNDGENRNTISSLIRTRTMIDGKEELRRIRMDLRQIRVESQQIQRLMEMRQNDELGQLTREQDVTQGQEKNGSMDGTRDENREERSIDLPVQTMQGILARLTGIENYLEELYGDHESEASEVRQREGEDAPDPAAEIHSEFGEDRQRDADLE